MGQGADLEVPQTAAELRAYTTRYFQEFDELVRQGRTGERDGDGPVPSELIFNLFDDDRVDEAWSLIMALVDAAPTRQALDFIGAGVLEDLVGYYAGERIYRAIVENARENDRLRKAIASMYWPDKAPEWFRSEVEALQIPS